VGISDISTFALVLGFRSPKRGPPPASPNTLPTAALIIRREYKWGPKYCGGCDAEYVDTGCTCFKGIGSYWKKSYGRGVGKASLDTYAKKTEFLTPYPLSFTFPTAPRHASATGAAPTPATAQSSVSSSDPIVNPNTKFAGFKWRYSTGSTNVDPVLFDEYGLEGHGTTSDLTDLKKATRIDDYSSQETANMLSFSVLWTGHIRPTVTGDFTFKTNSDGSSYVWVGPTAESGFTQENAVVQNGGMRRSVQEVTGTMRLSAGALYPIRIIYSFKNQGEQPSFSFAFMVPNSLTNKLATNVQFTPPIVKNAAVETFNPFGDLEPCPSG
jgi:hypothetical protein